MSAIGGAVHVMRLLLLPATAGLFVGFVLARHVYDHYQVSEERARGTSTASHAWA